MLYISEVWELQRFQTSATAKLLVKFFHYKTQRYIYNKHTMNERSHHTLVLSLHYLVKMWHVSDLQLVVRFRGHRRVKLLVGQ